MDMQLILTTGAINIFKDYIKQKLRNRLDKKGLDFSKIEKGIGSHLLDVAKWSSQFSFIEMSKPGDIDEMTVKLDLHTQPRQFRGREDGNNIKSENDTFFVPLVNSVRINSKSITLDLKSKI